MNEREISRRAMLKGSAALAALVALGFPLEALEVEAAAGEEILPWLDQPPPFPGPPDRSRRSWFGRSSATNSPGTRSSSPSSTTVSGW